MYQTSCWLVKKGIDLDTVCALLAVGLIPNHMIIIVNKFYYFTVKQPVKILNAGSCLSTTSNDIISSQ